MALPYYGDIIFLYRDSHLPFAQLLSRVGEVAAPGRSPPLRSDRNCTVTRLLLYTLHDVSTPRHWDHT